MDDIQEMIDRLPQLTDAELSALEDKIIQQFESVEAQDITRETVNQMTFLADTVETVRAEVGRREAEVNQLAQQAAEAATRVVGEDEEAQPDEAEALEDQADALKDQAEALEDQAEAVPTEGEEPVAEEFPDFPVGEGDVPEEAVAEAPVEGEGEAPAEGEEVPAEGEPEAEGDEEEEEEQPPPIFANEAEQDTATEGETLATEDEQTAATESEAEQTLATEGEAEQTAAVEAEAEQTLATDGEAVEATATEGEQTLSTEAEAEQAVTAEAEQTLATEGEQTLAAQDNASETEPVAAAEASDSSTVELAVSDEADTSSTEAHMDSTSAGTFAAPADRQPVPRQGVSPAPITVIAGGDIPGITAGSPLKDVNALSDAFSTRLHSLRRVSGNTGEQVVVASLLASFPEDRVLRTNEVDSNSSKIKSVTNPFTIVASGGWCAPLPVNYDIFAIGGSTNTPLRDSLPVFNADRGGIRYVAPPVISDYTGAIGVWTNQMDIDAATDPNVRKPCLTVQCAAEDQVYLDAVTMCMCFGNLQTRAFPELVARHNELALIMAARFGETYILDAIKAKSTPVGPVDATLGTGRDILISVERAATAYRYTHRLDPNLPLRFVAPQWLHAMIRSDITAQLPGDGMDTTFALADEAINRFFTFRNINPVWTLEGSTGGDIPQYTDYPDKVEWALFAEGTFTLLDGGTLDIGIVRDSELVAKNDYCMFTEQFLAVAKTGVEGIWVEQNLAVSGGSAGTLDVSLVDY